MRCERNTSWRSSQISHFLRSSVLIGGIGGLLGAQQVIPDAPSCASCSVSLLRVTTLGADSGAGSINTSPSSVAIDGRGRYWVTQEGELPAVYDRTGRFVQYVGAKGSGPGEFVDAYALSPLPGDSMLVHDNGRFTVIGPDLRFVRTIPKPTYVGVGPVIDWPGLAILNRGAWGRDVMQPTLLRVTFGADGASVIGEFGPDRGDLPPNVPLRQRVGGVNGRTVWSADIVYRYRISHWNIDGTLIRSFERTPSWFTTPGPPQAPRPYVQAVVQDTSGLVWTFVTVRSPTWREAMPPTPPAQPGGVVEIPSRKIAFEKLYRTVIEVVDPRTSTLLTQGELGEWVVFALGDGRAAIYMVDAGGVARIQIVQVVLRR